MYEQKRDEMFVVFLPDTLINPDTMMIKQRYTYSAKMAMLGLWNPFDLTNFAF